MNCEICGRKRIFSDGTPNGVDYPGVCDSCRKHAEIGRRVEAVSVNAAISLHAAEASPAGEHSRKIIEEVVRVAQEALKP